MNDYTPKYIQIINTIKKQIISRKLKPGTRIPKEAEYAKQFHVARKTLRNAFAFLERDGFLLRKKSVGTIIAPKALHNKHLHADLAVLIKVVNNDYSTYADVFSETEGYLTDLIKQLTSRGYLLRFIPWFYNTPNYYTADTIIKKKNIDGFIINSPMYMKPLMNIIASNKIPHVALETEYCRPGVNTVMNDCNASVYQAVKKLFSLGHRKIGLAGCLLKKAEINTAAYRTMTAFVEICTDLKIPTKKEWIINYGHQCDQKMSMNLTDLYCEMFLRSDRPTAVVVTSGLNIDNLFEALKIVKLCVPKDLSVICNLMQSPIQVSNNIKITGYIPDNKTICINAINSILGWLKNPAYKPSCNKILPLRISGESVRPYCGN